MARAKSLAHGLRLASYWLTVLAFLIACTWYVVNPTENGWTNYIGVIGEVRTRNIFQTKFECICARVAACVSHHVFVPRCSLLGLEWRLECGLWESGPPLYARYAHVFFDDSMCSLHHYSSSAFQSIEFGQ
jgi:hypothetical protein